MLQVPYFCVKPFPLGKVGLELDPLMMMVMMLMMVMMVMMKMMVMIAMLRKFVGVSPSL